VSLEFWRDDSALARLQRRHSPSSSALPTCCSSRTATRAIFLRALALPPCRPLALSPRRPLDSSPGRPFALIPVARLLRPSSSACLALIVRLSCHASSLSAAMEVPPQAKKARIGAPGCGGAKFVTTETLAALVSSCHKHFAEYSRTKKRVVQRVPGKVWKQVYADYKAMQACPFADVECDVPAERTLQDALRSALDPDTGVSDPSGAAMVVPQSEDVLRALKQSDGHARRVMLRLRDRILGGTAPTRGGDVGETDEQDICRNYAGEDTVPGNHSNVDGSSVGGGGEDRSVRVSNDSNSNVQNPAAITAGRRASSSRSTAALESMANAMTNLTESASTTGASMQSIARSFEVREQSRMESEKLSIRRARLDEIKWLHENDVINGKNFSPKSRH
jgi:hypothetical protein